MPEPILCKICGQRRARRACPAVSGDICNICCGTEREVTLSCPLGCVYLVEGHRHEKSLPVDPKDVTHPEIEITEAFIRDHEELLLFAIYSMLNATLKTEGAVDTDVLQALDALIKTQLTAQSGLVYETRAENTIAAAIQRGFSASLVDYEKVRAERESLAPIKSSEIFKILVFLRRFGEQNLNGKPKGRMFLDILKHMTPEQRVDERAPSIIM
jgi:hypothetical protein